MRTKHLYTLIILIFTILNFSSLTQAKDLSIILDLAADSNKKIIAQKGDRPVLTLINAIPGVSYDITPVFSHEDMPPMPGVSVWNPILSSSGLRDSKDLISSLKNAAGKLINELKNADDEQNLLKPLQESRKFLKLFNPESLNSKLEIYDQLSPTDEFKYLAKTDLFKDLLKQENFKDISVEIINKNLWNSDELKQLQATVNGTILTENRDVKIDLDMGDTITYQIVRNDSGGTRPKKEWLLTVTVPWRGSWQINFGLAALPNNDQLYYFEESTTTPGTYVIKQQTPTNGYNIRPVLFYTWKDPSHQEWFRPSAGISLEAKPALFLGQDFVFHDNFHILMGYAFEPQKRLSGSFRLNQEISGTLPDSLVTESYQGNWFIALTFFFGNNYSPTSTPDSSSQPANE